MRQKSRRKSRKVGKGRKSKKSMKSMVQIDGFKNGFQTCPKWSKIVEKIQFMAQYNDLKIKIKIQDIGTDHLGLVSDFDDDLTAG